MNFTYHIYRFPRCDGGHLGILNVSLALGISLLLLVLHSNSRVFSNKSKVTTLYIAAIYSNPANGAIYRSTFHPPLLVIPDLVGKNGIGRRVKWSGCILRYY